MMAYNWTCSKEHNLKILVYLMYSVCLYIYL